MPPDPPREQGPPGLATPTQINATPTSKTVENPVSVRLEKVDYITSPSNGQGKINGGHMANCLHCCPITNL